VLERKLESIANFVAVDLGASSGRVLVGQWDGHRFTLEELHRFSNEAVSVLGTLYWDVLRIWSEIEAGLLKYQARFGASPAGISVDAWGVDFALLDRQGKLIGDPVHYRDARTDGIIPLVMERIPAADLYRETAVQTMQINTIFQLYSMVLSKSPHLASAETFLMIPDLFNYFLCGEKAVEYSQATTTQMYSGIQRDWARNLLQPLGLPLHILPRIIHPGSVLGQVLPEVFAKARFSATFPVIAGASHDTASAVAGTPNLDPESVFLSSGTWSLMGVESGSIVNSDDAFALNFTNEGGVDGSVLLLKNITGLWLLQECQRQWTREGRQLGWEEILHLAAEAKPFRSLLFPDASDFRAPASMPAAIQNYCCRSAQPVPESVGEIARACLESLCLRYRAVLEEIRRITGRELRTIRVVGGGSQNRLLSQWTADACECEVVCGPVEASAMGNVMMQAVTTGYLPDVKAGRDAIAASASCVTYMPHESGTWKAVYLRFQQLDRGRVD
jgi:rhamnulokinase